MESHEWTYINPTLVNVNHHRIFINLLLSIHGVFSLFMLVIFIRSIFYFLIGRGRVKLFLKDRRIRTLSKVVYILYMDRTLIYVSKMGDGSVHTLMEKDTRKIILGLMDFM